LDYFGQQWIGIYYLLLVDFSDSIVFRQKKKREKNVFSGIIDCKSQMSRADPDDPFVSVYFLRGPP